jgi:hypothetical protein
MIILYKMRYDGVKKKVYFSFSLFAVLIVVFVVVVENQFFFSVGELGVAMRWWSYAMNKKK